MAKRTKSQQIGSEGQRLVEYMIEKSGRWIARTQDEDFGIDLEAELTVPKVSGQFLKLQVKTTESLTVTRDGVPFRVPRSLVSYADICRIPVLQIQVDLRRKEAWYLWIQRWLLEQRRHRAGLNDLPEFISLHIPKASTLRTGLKGELQSVAEWRTNEQLVLTLNDAIRTSASLYRHDVLTSLIELLSKIDVISEDFPVDLVIDQAVSLGPDLWATPSGNQASSALYAVCSALGHRFTASQVWNLVVRDEVYSRTGINALGVLYDEHPEHTASLGLIELFEKHPDPRPAYYCRLRERFLGEASVGLLRIVPGLAIGGWMVNPQIADWLHDKWANRGDSALLDYLVEAPVKPE